MNLIVFGSLLHPDELYKHGITNDMIKYVKVSGYKRVFDQEPSWRKSDSIYRAVMNIKQEKNSWFNAIAILNLSKEYFKSLDIRERGYDRTPIKDGKVTTYENQILNDCIVYVGKKGKQNNEIYPNKEYFKLCSDGAKSHFEQFEYDYINTTYYYKEKKLTSIVCQ